MTKKIQKLRKACSECSYRAPAAETATVGDWEACPACDGGVLGVEAVSIDPTAPHCYYCCGQTLVMRPYGPDGSWVCFPCIRVTPERDAAAGEQYCAQREAAERNSNTVMIGESTGPRPLGGKHDA